MTDSPTLPDSPYVNVSKATATIEEWTAGRSYRFHVLITREDDGTFSIVALNLPGVGSIGDTEKEALTNFREAAGAALESYATSGDAIPWKNNDDVPADASHRWIIVRV